MSQSELSPAHISNFVQRATVGYDLASLTHAGAELSGGHLAELARTQIPENDRDESEWYRLLWIAILGYLSQLRPEQYQLENAIGVISAQLQLMDRFVERDWSAEPIEGQAETVGRKIESLLNRELIPWSEIMTLALLALGRIENELQPLTAAETMKTTDADSSADAPVPTLRPEQPTRPSRPLQPALAGA